MHGVKSVPIDIGPLSVIGDAGVIDNEGNLITASGGEISYLCRCRRSTNKPFCDGSHEGNFESIMRAENNI